MANLAWGAIRTSGAMLSWLFSGMFQRFPNLKIALSEGEIGWMPYFLERAEQVLDKQRYWVMRGQKFMDHATTDVDLDTLNVRELFRDHVFGCFIEDHHGIASLDEIGEDNVMCETDYPHSDSTWPNCITAVKKVIGTSRRRPSTSSCAATPSGCTGSPRPSRRPRADGRPVTVDRDSASGAGLHRVRAGDVRPRRETKAVVTIPGDDRDIRTAVDACPRRAALTTTKE